MRMTSFMTASAIASIRSAEQAKLTSLSRLTPTPTRALVRSTLQAALGLDSLSRTETICLLLFHTMAARQQRSAVIRSSNLPESVVSFLFALLPIRRVRLQPRGEVHDR